MSYAQNIGIRLDKDALYAEIKEHIDNNEYEQVIQKSNIYISMYKEGAFDETSASVIICLSYAYFVSFRFVEGESIALRGIRQCKALGIKNDLLGELYRNYSLNARSPLQRLHALNEALKYSDTETQIINVWLSFLMECSFNAQYNVAERVIPKLKVKVNLIGNKVIKADYYRHLAILYMFKDKYYQCLHFARLSMRLFKKHAKAQNKKLDVKYFQIRFYDIIISIKLKFANLAKEELEDIIQEINDNKLEGNISLQYLLRVTKAHYAFFVLKDYEAIYKQLFPIKDYILTTFLHEKECMMLYNTCEILGYYEDADYLKSKIQKRLKKHYALSSAQRNANIQTHFLLHGTEHYSSSMKKLISKEIELREELKSEKQKTEGLLQNIFPKETLAELRKNNKIAPKKFENASVLFADIKGFTGLTEKLSPEELIYMLNLIFTTFDEIALKYNVERIKTLGDCYLAVSGVPVNNPKHLQNLVFFALEILKKLPEINKQLNLHETIELRIGIDMGELTAGVLGTMKASYDIWGKSVYTAQKMEQRGQEGKICCTPELMEEIKVLMPDIIGHFVVG